tara:strand:- start:4456 stop:6246 length:1791 start_codon:yes stop_codon:yes gene_type:complete
MATNSQVTKVIKIVVEGNQAKATMDGVTLSTKELNQELKSVQTNMKGTSNATGGATATVLELGRTISDANYGIRGMANNLSQLVSNLVFTTRAAGGVAAGFKQIWSAMMGPLGLILAFQGVIALLERFSMEQNKAKEKTSETTDEIERQITSLEKLTALTLPIRENLRAIEGLNSGVLTLSESVEILNKKYKDFRGGFQKLSEEQKKDPATVMKLVKLYEKFIKTRDELEKKTERAIELQREIEESGGEFIKSGGLVTRNPLAFQLDGLNVSIQKLLKRENELSNFFTFVKTGGSKGGNEGKETGPQEPISLGEDLLTRSMEIDAEVRRRFFDSISSLGEEAAIRASEGNIQLLQEEIGHQKLMTSALKEGTIERLEAEQQLANMKMDLQDREFEHEMMLLDLRMQAQLEYVDFVSGIGQVFSTLGKESEELAKVGLIIEKGAAVAGVVIETQKANAQILSASATEVGFYKAAAAVNALNPGALAFYEGKAAQAQAGAAKRVTKNNVGAAIAIANILATTLTSRSLSGGGGRAGGGEGGGGRAFDFNLVGSTGTNQLAEAVGGQFQQPVQAYVVSSEMTSQQELDLQIEAGASVGD